MLHPPRLEKFRFLEQLRTPGYKFRKSWNSLFKYVGLLFCQGYQPVHLVTYAYMPPPCQVSHQTGMLTMIHPQQAESESQDNPISPDSHVNALTRISSVASSSASSVVTNDSSNLMQEMDNDTVPSCGIGPLNRGKPVPSITVIGDQNDQ